MSTKWQRFEPSDFAAIHKEAVKNGYASYNAGDMWEPSDTLKMLVDAANAKLDRILAELRAEATVVYGILDFEGEFIWDAVKRPTDTHRAWLFDIEPLAKEPCKHEPDETTGMFYGARNWVDLKCRHCGVRLRAEWRELEEES